MPRLTHTLAEWIAIAQELTAPRPAAVPAGLAERIRALVEQAPEGWPEQMYALELDDASAAAVAGIQSTLTGSDPDVWQRTASVAEADAIVRDHQRRR
ncbi:MAG: hypothetical protein AVDCRST_MAG59-1430 [uncultured Thermomicrobiales bacterium]|uniref:Uncharacterized protein n=1 Tax=uncultured Thermomicrobiales bacterium TaxID=1645740 RepID=A0A6J4UE72_9BACT|nr:MAG: hypothetical protein AVDCRST_MAG59-1430 [uncultured Thermomicrobiales bacterium]